MGHFLEASETRMRKDLHEANRLSWNAATVAHNSHKGDQAGFFRRGGSTLFPEEIDFLAEVASEGIDIATRESVSVAVDNRFPDLRDPG